MASKDINLLSTKKEQTTQQVRLQLYLAKVTPIVVMVVILMGIVVFVGDWFSMRLLSNQSNQIEQYKRTIQDNESQEGTYMAVLQKTTILKKILAGRKPYSEFLSYLRTFAVEGTSIQSIELDDKQNLKITLIISNSDAIQHVISSIEENGKSFFGEAELTSVVQSPSAYDVTFTFRDLKITDSQMEEETL